MADEDQGPNDPTENETNEAAPEAESPDPASASDPASDTDTPSPEGAAAEDALDAAQDAVSELSDQAAQESPAPEESNTAEEDAALAAVMAAVQIAQGGEPEPAPAAEPENTQLENDAIDAVMAALQAEAGGGDTAAAPAPTAAPTPAQAAPPAGASTFEMPDLSGAAPADGHIAIDLISDVNLNVKIELGRTRMLVDDVLRLSEGAVVELEKLAGDPVDIYVNDRPVARGEVLVLNDNFCVRINEILDNTAEAVERMG
ncbi:flagellar motor switch protein FliN [Roseiflexus sp. AH-315-K22]|nr:flagellar motor switch protein FliN [Roseiflexus sp. AH-315-K22]